jgi:NADPH-dependent 7-cyano-7-deazaguanine reductase QueF
MKSKNQSANKKLVLIKETITVLSNQQKLKVLGGGDNTGGVHTTENATSSQNSGNKTQG